jgi:hypothetical protein
MNILILQKVMKLQSSLKSPLDSTSVDMEKGKELLKFIVLFVTEMLVMEKVNW